MLLEAKAIPRRNRSSFMSYQSLNRNLSSQPAWLLRSLKQLAVVNCFRRFHGAGVRPSRRLNPAARAHFADKYSDPSGAVVPNATVAILQSGGPTHSAKTNNNGNYEIGNLPAGSYTVTANATGLQRLSCRVTLRSPPGRLRSSTSRSKFRLSSRRVNVQEETPQVR